jgi:hypothetical protein
MSEECIYTNAIFGFPVSDQGFFVLVTGQSQLQEPISTFRPYLPEDAMHVGSSTPKNANFTG